MNKHFLIFILTIIIISAFSWLIILYARGYRIANLTNNNSGSRLEKTGMLVVKSYPDGAKVYVDDVLEGPTHVNISNIKPGFHSLRIVKEGYFEYSKSVEVFEELVTVVDALLIPQSPSLQPLTYNGVDNISLSPSKELLVYSSKGNGEPGGIWKLSLNGSPSLVISDTSAIKYSESSEINWSPSETEILIKVKNQYYLVSLTLPNLAVKPVEGEPILQTWGENVKERETIRLSKLNLESHIEKVATDSSTVWSSDKKQFLYKAYDSELKQYQYHIYNLAEPLPVGKTRDTIAYYFSEEVAGKNIFWYGNSTHLVSVEDGKIYLMETDGDNKTLLFSGQFDPLYVFSRPGSFGIIILTTFNNNAPANFYLVGF